MDELDGRLFKKVVNNVDAVDLSRESKVKQMGDDESQQIRVRGKVYKWLYNHSKKDESLGDRIWRLIKENEELERRPYQV